MQYLCHPLGDYCQDPNYYIHTYYSYDGGWDHQYGKLDIPCPNNTEFFSMTNGTVTSIWTSGGVTGLEITTTDVGISRATGQGIVIRYLHWNEIYVSEGDTVTIGQKLGLTGDQGSPGAYHLHIDMRWSDMSASNSGAVHMGRFESEILPYYDYHTRENETIRDYNGGIPHPIEDYYLYHIFTSDILKVQIDSGTAPAGGIEYDPAAYGFTPAPNSEYGTRVFSASFMGPYPATQADLDNNYGLKLLYVGAFGEYSVKEEAISYGKLFRNWILHQPNEGGYDFRSEGRTLEDFGRYWAYKVRQWVGRDDISTANNKTDWDLDAAQKLYNNIRYGPAYGLTSSHTIEGFQCWPWTNETTVAGSSDIPDRQNVVNLAEQVPLSYGYYTMYCRTGHFNLARQYPQNPAVISAEEHEHQEIDGIHYFDGLMVVNKSYGISNAAISSIGGLRPEVQSAFNDMKAAWNQYVSTHTVRDRGGTNMSIVSGWRSYATQQTFYNNYVSSSGQAAADTYSARPGYSEHHTGYAIDITLADSGRNDYTTSFVYNYPTQADWLAQHCHEFGFILRYPNGKDSITGYIYEPWHFRYVGTEWAAKLRNTTIEEYFGIDSKYQ